MIAVAPRAVISPIGPASPAATDAVPPAFRNVVGGDEGRGRARPTGAGRGREGRTDLGVVVKTISILWPGSRA